MPTYVALAAEAVWRAEIAAPALETLAQRLRAHYGLTADDVGSRGDNNHLNGYHRSRAWVLGSSYCTNRLYSVTETAGNRSGGDSNWACALDITPATRDDLLGMCQRLDAAVRAGQLEKITQWFGNADGDEIVDGWDNIRNRVSRSDSSHLWHLHLSFDRGRANEDHSDVFAVLTGTAPSQARGDGMYFLNVGPNQLCADSTLERFWAFDNEARWIAVRAACGNPPIVAVTQADLDAGVYGQYQGVYSIPRKPAELTMSAELTDEELARIAEAAKAGAEAGAPTHEELVAAAEEGSNKAEDS